MIESVLSAISPPERRIKFDRVLALNPAFVQNKISQFLEGDCAHEDITTLSTVQMETVSEASIVAREPLVFAAEQIVPHCFGETCHVELRVTDGAEVALDEKIAVISGPETAILARERVILNLLQHLSGIATCTRRYVDVRIAECDNHGVDVQVLSTVFVMFSYWAQARNVLEVSKFLNDHIAKTVSSVPHRIAGLGTLPMQEPTLRSKSWSGAWKN